MVIAKQTKRAREKMTAVSAAEQGMIIAVVRSGSKAGAKQRAAARPKFQIDRTKAAFVAMLVAALLAASFNTPFAGLGKPGLFSSAAVSGDTIAIARTAPSVTAAATGYASYDPAAWHVIYWLLLAAALIPLELELRKRNEK